MNPKFNDWCPYWGNKAQKHSVGSHVKRQKAEQISFKPMETRSPHNLKESGNDFLLSLEKVPGPAVTCFCLGSPEP